MICNKCGYEVPNNAIFCTNCGSRVSAHTNSPSTPKENIAKDTFSPNFENSFSSDTPTIIDNTPKPADNKIGFGEYIKNNLILLIVAAVLFTSTIVLAICTITLSNKSTKLAQSNQYLSDEINELNEIIDSSKQDNDDLSAFYEDEVKNSDNLKEELEQLKEQYSEALGASMAYEDKYFNILDSLNTSNIGMASETFYLSDGILVLDGGDNAKVELYTLSKESGTIDIDKSGDSASLMFSENNWDYQTTLNISAQSSGVTVFSISNSTELEPLRLIVIVR